MTFAQIRAILGVAHVLRAGGDDLRSLLTLPSVAVPNDIFPRPEFEPCMLSHIGFFISVDLVRNSTTLNLFGCLCT